MSALYVSGNTVTYMINQDFISVCIKKISNQEKTYKYIFLYIFGCIRLACVNTKHAPVKARYRSNAWQTQVLLGLALARPKCCWVCDHR